ncbi:HD domain-containing phosphohydrolase [Chryseomicrobium palamuruense]|uniref:HD domain-containing phosphohydrolase n=1 Tax=Chryseomicrobium palamuruense TaxID=682973 RepID=A0ABV8UUV6_9BACL
MEGLTVGKKGSTIETVEYSVSKIGLLARGNGAEVLVQNIDKDKLFYLYPSENPDVMEFYYILEGEVECELDGEMVCFSPGDYFSAQNLIDTILFKTLSEVTVLWVVTEPTFVNVSKEISSLMEIVKKVEAKDNYTYMHSDRVAEYAVKIARKLRVSTNVLNRITESAYLHDIGKIDIPAEILNKPGKLTKEEFDVVKRHPEDGAKMLEGTMYESLKPILEQHHERLDGSGYPRGLKEDEILLEAKIIAVSDTFDAMTEDRAYRNAYSAEYAMNEIKRLSGIHYDPSVVEAFEQVLKEDGKIE